MSENSPFFSLSLSELRTIFERNEMRPKGRKNWRKSFIGRIEELEHEELVLEEDEFQQVFGSSEESTDDERVQRYRVSLTGHKRKRKIEEDEDEEEDVIEPSRKKRKVEEVDNEMMEYIISKMKHTFMNITPEIEQIEQKNISLLEKMEEFIEEIKKRLSCDRHRKLIFIVEYFRHMIDERRMWDNIFLSEYEMNDFFFSRISKLYQEKTMEFFQDHVNDGVDDEVQINRVSSLVKKGFSDEERGLRKNIINIVDIVLDAKNRKIQLKVTNCNGEDTLFNIDISTPLRRLMDAYCRNNGQVLGSVRFTFDGSRLNPDATPYELEMVNGDVIFAMVEQTGGKPVVLLYPPTDNFQVSNVKVSLNEHLWNLDSHYPNEINTQILYSEEKEEKEVKSIVEWKDMPVNRNGLVTFNNENFLPKQVEYLFWESSTIKQFDFNDIDHVYLVQRKNVTSFLYYHLSIMGLPEKECNNFICFWIKQLEEKNFCLFQFMRQEEYEKLVDLEVKPRPDEVMKIFLLFITFDSMDSIKDEKRGRIERDLKKVEFPKKLDFGNKFIVIEWGGMNLKLSKWVK